MKILLVILSLIASLPGISRQQQKINEAQKTAAFFQQERKMRSQPFTSAVSNSEMRKIVIPKAKFEIKIEGTEPGQWLPTNITEKNIVDAEAQPYTTNGVSVDNQAVIKATLDADGRDKFAKMTSENISKQTEVFINNELIFAPVIQEPITDGIFVIAGNIPLDQAQTISNQLRGYYYSN